MANELIDKNWGSWTASKDYWRSRWNDRIRNYKLYTGLHKEKKTASRADFHVPYVSALLINVWTLLTAKMPFARVSGRNTERDKESSRLMDELVKYTYDVNNFDAKFMQAIKESMIYDTAWVRTSWEYQNKKSDHPKLSLLNTMDVFPHPQKVSIDDHFPVYIRSEMTKMQMKNMGWDEKEIKKLQTSKLETSDWRREQLRAFGLTNAQIKSMTNEKDDLYEVVEIYGKHITEEDDGKMYHLVVANGDACLNTKVLSGRKPYQLPYDHNEIPITPIPYEPDPHILLGNGFISPVADMQIELNTLENEKADNARYRNNPPLKVRRSANVDLETLAFITGLPWLMDNPDDVLPFEFPDLAMSIERQQEMIKRHMQVRTGANDVLLVSDDISIQGGETATGAAIANENTKLRFRPHARDIDKALERIGRQIISMFQQSNLFDREKAISIAGKEGMTEFVRIRPSDVKGDLVYKVDTASMIAESESIMLQKLLNLRALFMEKQNFDMGLFDDKILEAANLDPNEFKPTKQDQIGDLSVKLNQLVAITQKPGFNNHPEAVKQQVINAIQQIQGMVGGGQQQMPQEQMMGGMNV